MTYFVKIIGSALLLYAALFLTREYERSLGKGLRVCRGFCELIAHIRRRIDGYLTPANDLLNGFECGALDETGYISKARERGLCAAYFELEAELPLDGRVRGEARTREAISALANEDNMDVLKSLIARQRKQLAEARTAINDLTGGRAQVSPLELMLAPIDAKPRLLGTKSSVKGPAHTFRRVELPGVITPPQIEFQEDKKQKQIDGFKSLITPVPAEELTSSKEDLHNFNDFMTSRNRDEDDY